MQKWGKNFARLHNQCQLMKFSSTFLFSTALTQLFYNFPLELFYINLRLFFMFYRLLYKPIVYYLIMLHYNFLSLSRDEIKKVFTSIRAPCLLPMYETHETNLMQFHKLRAQKYYTEE